MKTPEFVVGKCFRDALQNVPFSFVLAGNITKFLKEALLGEGIQDFPVLALTGPPGSGKTSVARAGMSGKISEYMFTDKVSYVRNQLAKPEMQDEYVLLDDCADFASQAARQKAATYLDEVVRGSYTGTGPLIIITVEEKALERITQSCRMRMIEVPVGDVLENPILNGNLSDLQQNKEMLHKLFGEFGKWYENNSGRYHYQEWLKKFRERHQGKDSRSISLFFIYFVSLAVFNNFMKEIYRVEISLEKIEENYLEIWEKRINSTLSRRELVRKLFQQLLEDEAFKPIAPQPQNICTGLCEGMCQNVYDNGELDCEECYMTAHKRGYYYSPRDLLLESDEASSVLIEAGKYIYQYPSYCDGDSPLLIVRDGELLALMNSELHKLCCGQKINISWFGPKELHQLLFEANMCMYHYISSEHKTYVFSYESVSKIKESVMVLRLTMKQFELLSKTAKPPFIGNYFGGKEWRSFCRKLKELGNSIHGMAGE